jgi:hypothetical protein
MENHHDEETIDSLVKEFVTYGKLAAEHHIRRCSTLVRAKAKGKNGFVDFCERVHCKPDSSTTRKYLKIGLEADWLLPIAPHLPPEWTTIYDVAVLGRDNANELIEQGVLNPQAPAKVLKKLDSAKADPAEANDEDAQVADSAAGACILAVDASSLSDQDLIDLYGALAKSANWYGLSVAGLCNGAIRVTFAHAAIRGGPSRTPIDSLPTKSKLFTAVIDDYIRFRERDHRHGKTSYDLKNLRSRGL